MIQADNYAESCHWCNPFSVYERCAADYEMARPFDTEVFADALTDKATGDECVECAGSYGNPNTLMPMMNYLESNHRSLCQIVLVLECYFASLFLSLRAFAAGSFAYVHKFKYNVANDWRDFRFLY